MAKGLSLNSLKRLRVNFLQELLSIPLSWLQPCSEPQLVVRSELVSRTVEKQLVVPDHGS